MMWWIAQNLAVTLALALGVWCCCRWTRIGPVARHALWLVVLVKMLTPPLVAWPWAIGNPAWGARDRMPAMPTPAHASAAAVEEVTPSEPNTSDSGPLRPPIVIVLPEDAMSPAMLPTPIVPGDAAATAEPPSPAMPPPTVVAEGGWSLDWILTALASVWIAGSLIVMAVEAVRIRRMRRLVNTSDAADEDLADRVERLCRRMSVRPVSTIRVAGLTSPAVWGFTRPVLLWPANLPATAGTQGLIVHELAHVRRRDHWVGWLELVAAIAWWWNPLFWYVRHQLRENAELACDGWVVDVLPGGRRAYAEGLISVCELSSRPPSPMPAVGVSTGGRRFLERRLVMIMKERVGLRIPRIGLATIALLAMTALPAWSRKAETPPSENTAEGTSARDAVETIGGLEEAHAISGDVLHSYTRARLGMPDTTREVTLRRELIAALQKLREAAAASGRQDEVSVLDQRILALQAEDGIPVSTYRGQTGKTIALPAIGSTIGSVWGGENGVYTDDSDLGTAAVHAGILRPGERQILRVEILHGQGSYGGSTQNGVTSSSYGAWHGSYRILPVAKLVTVRRYPGPGATTAAPPAVPKPPIHVTPQPAPAIPGMPSATPPTGTTAFIPAEPAENPISAARGQAGKGKLVLILVDVIGSATGHVWGDGVYTDDSSVAAAAVHAGLLKPGQRATVVVQVLPGRDSYAGSTRNGVTSSSYGAWGGSFQLLGSAEAQHAETPRVEATRVLRLSGVLSDASLVEPPGLSRNNINVVPPPTNVTTIRVDPATPYGMRDVRGEVRMVVVGAVDGTVWGSGVYTDDSNIAAAAVHAGVVKIGETAAVKITYLPGQPGYDGSEKNGVTTRPYGAWTRSFKIERAD